MVMWKEIYYKNKIVNKKKTLTKTHTQLKAKYKQLFLAINKQVLTVLTC